MVSANDPKIELTQAELNQETVYCFEHETLGEAERLMHLSNLSQLPVLTRGKRMVGIVTLEDIAREDLLILLTHHAAPSVGRLQRPTRIRALGSSSLMKLALDS